MYPPPKSLFSDPVFGTEDPLGAPSVEPAAQQPKPPSMFAMPGDEQRVESGIKIAGEVTPDEAGRILRLGIRTGLPDDLIRRNLDYLEKETARRDFDADQFRRQSPIVMDWLASNPYYTAVAQDDLTSLTTLES